MLNHGLILLSVKREFEIPEIAKLGITGIRGSYLQIVLQKSRIVLVTRYSYHSLS